MTLDELKKQALALPEAERRQLINALAKSLTNSPKRAPYGCMEETGEILEDIVAPALAESEWEVLRKLLPAKARSF
jgi:hypothetical protein